MTIYAVKLARLNDGSIVPSEANLGIFYRTKKQAADLIRSIEEDPERCTGGRQAALLPRHYRGDGQQSDCRSYVRLGLAAVVVQYS